MSLESIETPQGHIPTAVRAVRDAADRAGSRVRETIADVFDRAHDLIQEADGWVGDVREFVRTHPLQAIAATIGIGFILGKLARKGASPPDHDR
jgi:ElaB/YqjD/DUF883 family membrane-anchored ribosome-binding protein